MNKDRNRDKVDVYPWILQKRGIDVNTIISAPTPLRNKSEFTFGYRYLFDNENNSDGGNVGSISVEKNIERNNNDNKKTSSGDDHPQETNNDVADTKMNEHVSVDDNNNKDDRETKNIVEQDVTTKNIEEWNNTTTTGIPSNEDATVDEKPSEPKCVPACGFMVTGWAGGVCRPHGCDNIPTEHCTLVDLMDEFLLTSPLPVYDVKSHKGFWRLLTVRTSRRTKECMIIIQHTPPIGGGEGDKSASTKNENNINDSNGVDGDIGNSTCDYSKDFEIERHKLVKLLKEAELPVPDQAPLKVTSIFFQEFGGLSSPPPEHPVQVRLDERTNDLWKGSVSR